MEKISVFLTEREKESLHQLALDYGYKWGKTGNISALLRAIADGEITITKNSVKNTELNRDKEKSRTFLVHPGDKRTIRYIAIETKCLIRNRENISDLIRCIANNSIRLSKVQ
jgi:hypothetical protein